MGRAAAAVAAVGMAVAAVVVGWCAFVWSWCEQDRYDRGHLHE
jgi:hypothetical protein